MTSSPLPRAFTALLLLHLLSRASPAISKTAEAIQISDNRTAAGTLAGSVLTIRLDARAGEWHPDGDGDSGVMVNAFSVDGGPLQIPGPLIRVAEGTEIHAVVHNGLGDSPLAIHGFYAR